MKSDLVPWSYYQKRRRVTLPELLKTRGINSYDGLLHWANRSGVECPSEDDYKKATLALSAAKVKPVVKPAVREKAPPAPEPSAQAEETSPEPKKARTTRRRKSSSTAADKK